MSKIVSGVHLAALLKEALIVNSKTSELTGRFGEWVKAAVENGNLEIAPFAFMRKLAKMDEFKAKEFWTKIHVYFDLLREQGYFEWHVGDLDDMARAASAEAEREDDGQPDLADAADPADKEWNDAAPKTEPAEGEAEQPTATVAAKRRGRPPKAEIEARKAKAKSAGRKTEPETATATTVAPLPDEDETVVGADRLAAKRANLRASRKKVEEPTGGIPDDADAPAGSHSFVH